MNLLAHIINNINNQHRAKKGVLGQPRKEPFRLMDYIPKRDKKC